MTSIVSLQISGIRSFNPDPAARQTIHFQKPLTIILGKNGAGKTTIIESLLNATTGQMPPGAAAEKSAFVYDPKALGGESEVKGQIRLVFTGKGGKEMLVIRAFQLTRSKGKPKFESLDSVISYKDASGKVQSASYRSSDCDNIIPENLGVPKAVLEHVIFCHQEDCNWPLGPPGEVKKRFDDIFASTRYVAALDKLREISKEYKDAQKNNESALIALREHRETAARLAKECDERQAEVRRIEANNKEIEPRLKQLSAAVQAIDADSHRIETMSQEIAIIRGRVSEKERTLRQLRPRDATSEVQHDDVESLRQQQKQLGTTVKRVVEELAVTEGKLQAAEASRRAVANSSAEARGNLTALEHEAANHSRRIAELHRMIAGMTTDFVAGEGEFDVAALERVKQLMSRKVSEAQAALDSLRSGYSTSLAALTAERDTLLRFIDAEGKERDMKESQLELLAERIRAAEKSRPQAIPVADVEQLEQDVRNLTQQVDRERIERRDGTMNRELGRLLSAIEQQQGELTNLSTMLDNSKVTAETALRVGFLRHTVAQREQQESAKLAALVDSLHAAGAVLPSAPQVPSIAAASSVVASLKQRLTESLNTKSEEVRHADSESRSSAQSIDSAKRRIDALRLDIAKQKSIISSALGHDLSDATTTTLPATLLAAAEEEKARASRHLASLQSMSSCYESFIASARADHTCVVCDRGLTTQELEHFVRINEARRLTTPSDLQSAEAALNDATAAVSRLLKACSAAETLRALERDMQEANASLQGATKDLERTRAALADHSTKRRDLQRQLDGVETLSAQLRHLEEFHAETLRTADELTALEAAAGERSSSSSPSRDVLQKEYDRKSAELREMNAKLLDLQRAMSIESAQSTLDQQLSAKRGRLAEAKMALKRLEDVDQLLDALRSEAAGHKTRLAEIAHRKMDHQKALDGIATRLAQAEAAHNVALVAAQATLEAAQKNMTMLTEASRPIVEYFKGPSRAGEALEAVRSLHRSREAALKTADEEVLQLSNAIASMRAVLEDHRKRQAEIATLVQCAELQLELERDRAAITKIEESLVAIRSEKLQEVASFVRVADEQLEPNASAMSIVTKARDQCRAKASELERTKAQNTGILETLLAAIAEKRAILHGDKYRDVDARYASTLVKVQTTEHAIEDIEKYYRALDHAVSTYHAEKVTQINKIVSELWRLTYRGSDIDTIEIKSDDDTGSIARRSYKYRVVMKRGDTELDMRGRCSAGQKVLASVIIRMALSEAFCCDCGILALDEPTTNLDDDNARALAESLRDLIASRRYVTHFQLLVITHDEEFVRTLGAGHSADTYHYVQKDREGAYSIISERRFGELFA